MTDKEFVAICIMKIYRGIPLHPKDYARWQQLTGPGAKYERARKLIEEKEDTNA